MGGASSRGRRPLAGLRTAVVALLHMLLCAAAGPGDPWPTPRRLLLTTMGDGPAPPNANAPSAPCADASALLHAAALTLALPTHILTRYGAMRSDLARGTEGPPPPPPSVDVLVVNGPWDHGTLMLVHEFRRHAGEVKAPADAHARPVPVVLRCVEDWGLTGPPGGEPGVDGYILATAAGAAPGLAAPPDAVHGGCSRMPRCRPLPGCALFLRPGWVRSLAPCHSGELPGERCRPACHIPVPPPPTRAPRVATACRRGERGHRRCSPGPV
jgi:hypothetical protein